MPRFSSLQIGVGSATFAFGLATVWIPGAEAFSLEPYLILLGIAAVPALTVTAMRPESRWFRHPLQASCGTLLGLLALLLALHVLWPGRIMGCYVHTLARGGYNDWVCFGPVPFVTEGWPALSRAAWLAGVVLAVLGPLNLCLGLLLRLKSRHGSPGAGIGASTAT